MSASPSAAEGCVPVPSRPTPVASTARRSPRSRRTASPAVVHTSVISSTWQACSSRSTAPWTGPRRSTTAAEALICSPVTGSTRKSSSSTPSENGSPSPKACVMSDVPARQSVSPAAGVLERPGLRGERRGAAAAAQELGDGDVVADERAVLGAAQAGVLEEAHAAGVELPGADGLEQVAVGRGGERGDGEALHDGNVASGHGPNIGSS